MSWVAFENTLRKSAPRTVWTSVLSFSGNGVVANKRDTVLHDRYISAEPFELAVLRPVLLRDPKRSAAFLPRHADSFHLQASGYWRSFLFVGVPDDRRHVHPLLVQGIESGMQGFESGILPYPRQRVVDAHQVE